MVFNRNGSKMKKNEHYLEGVRSARAYYYSSHYAGFDRNLRAEDAIKLFLRAISSKKEYVVALNNLGETYRLNSEFENARRVFKTVLDLDSSNEFAMDSFELLMEKEQE